MASPTKEALKKKSIKDFNYGFNDQGQLRQIDPESGNLTDEPYKFEISDSQAENQKAYEELGETLTDYVYELLDKNGLHRIYLPADQPKSKAAFIFSTKEQNLLKDVDKLMVIIHGSGVVRAGQWARSLIINHSLDAGTVLPYIKRAQAKGYEVIITNTNDNYRDGKEIVGSGSPEEHGVTVWKQVVQPSNAKSIAVVAHSYGGVVVTRLSKKFEDDFDSKVFAVAFTDSVHSSANSRISRIGINFVSSSKPLGTPERGYSDGMPMVSAGSSKHEMTSYACIDELFKFLDKMYEKERGNVNTSSSEAGSSPEKDDQAAKKSKTVEL